MSEEAERPKLGAASEAEQLLLGNLEREALRSERLRALILAAFCGIGGLVFVILDSLLASHIALFQQYRSFGWRVGATMLPLMVYELCAFAILSRVLRSGRPVGHLLYGRYISAVLELLVPSALAYAFIELMHPVHGLLMPPTTLYYLFIMLSVLRFDFGLCMVTGCAAALQYMLLYGYGYSHLPSSETQTLLVTPFHHAAKALGFIVSGFFAGLLTRQLRQRVVRSLRLMAERNRVTSMFGLYVSPSVVDRLLSKTADYDGELRDVCVMFLDIRNFTNFAEKREPHEVVQFLNTLFSFMIETVSTNGGIINKFLGDGFMAVFGAPLLEGNPCDKAMHTALQIVRQLDSEVSLGRLPPTRIGIGIHFGPALTGSIGSPRRKEYTIIGDTVNLAARIEQLTKQYDAQILVSQAVLNAKQDPSLRGEPIGEVSVRGRQAPMALHKLA